MHLHNQGMRRLVASGLLPEPAGQPVKVWAHVSLAELRALDDRSVLQDQWIGEMVVRWAAHRAARPRRVRPTTRKHLGGFHTARRERDGPATPRQAQAVASRSVRNH
jgi:hypothetical protein